VYKGHMAVDMEQDYILGGHATAANRGLTSSN
jgi:hypothetical protein